MPLVASARIRAAEALASRRADQVVSARRALSDLRCQLHEAQADEEEAVRNCRKLRNLLRECEEELEAAAHVAEAHEDCEDTKATLRAQVTELEEELLPSPGVNHLLTPAQARHVFRFLW
ncbi:hypothetical protein P43SY_011035 [Pythium insidiosum]|uniref:Uncharacterized protein n=1 Tax=Pythium insidiosum TaxID=114742 RepID=A0AAD5LQD6_PYTIN|nr:hypothetical protein P43SY_011035 [Pythium insidiosum]